MSIRNYFENIADAIKDKNPNVINVTPAEMPNAIRSIPSGGSSTASDVAYDNTSGGLTATNVQDAIDELYSNLSELEPIVTNHFDDSRRVSINTAIGTSYTCPSDGIITCICGDGGGIYVQVNGYNVIQLVGANYNRECWRVRQGDVIYVNYSQGTKTALHFVPYA